MVDSYVYNVPDLNRKAATGRAKRTAQKRSAQRSAPRILEVLRASYLQHADRMSCTRDPILATLFLLGHAPLAVANYFESVEHSRRRAVPFRLCRLCNTRRVLVAISMACRLLFRL